LLFVAEFTSVGFATALRSPEFVLEKRMCAWKLERELLMDLKQIQRRILFIAKICKLFWNGREVTR
jgi:hypothetical protein